jgi:DNA invertase Pin-like site-specific DNA recombinase
MTSNQLSIALELYEKKHPIAEICRTLKISRATLYRAIKLGERDQDSRTSKHVSTGKL